MENLEIEGPLYEQAYFCMPILRALPDWFAYEAELVLDSVAIDVLPTLVAWHDGQAIGFLTLKQNTAYSAEIYVIGVRPQAHRQGIGRRLVAEAEEWVRARGVEYMQVKTLGPSSPSTFYARTRAFYFAMGFRPLEELLQIWDAENPCLLMVKRL